MNLILLAIAEDCRGDGPPRIDVEAAPDAFLIGFPEAEQLAVHPDLDKPFGLDVVKGLSCKSHSGKRDNNSQNQPYL